jgi:superfamily II DNA or RNA helicase
MQMRLPIESTQINVELPPIYAICERMDGNIIKQVLLPRKIMRARGAIFSEGRKKGYFLTPLDGIGESILALTNSAKPPNNVPYCIRMKDLEIENNQFISLDASKAKWVSHPLLDQIPVEPIDYQTQCNEIVNSWKKSFYFLEEEPENDIPGLRPPQIGAIHAVHAHWSVSNETATVVMPTGTGKTETMLSLLISKSCHRLLVIVPSDALRIQLADKFATLGILKHFGIVSETSQLPIVGILKRRPKSPADVDELFEKCNVIISTMNIAGQCTEEVQERMAYHCQYLFIDEAHHVSAKTWITFRQKFMGSHILQFTATPFRQDGKSIGGKFIYNYPLRKAQEEGYFRPITFNSIVEYDPAKHDLAIAEAAVNQLREDKDKGHILMARVGNIKRAEEVFQLYSHYEEFNPVTIHTGLGQSDRNAVRNEIINGTARIVVCVDMLGEGFDLPELKIAAFHDIRKSLPVTLQLVGRFTRARSDLGDPTFIANIADLNVQEELRLLYTQDPDWNLLLPQASKAAIEDEEHLWEFLEGFTKFPQEITLINLRPAMSTVVYKTTCEDWSPENFHEGIKGYSSLDKIYHDINHHSKTLVVVTTNKIPVEWAQMEEVYTFAWELFIAFWDQPQNLLFIHGSTNTGYYNNLAMAVAGEEVELIRGAPMFRCFSGVNRLRLQNVGLLKTLGRLIRYEMRAGSDVEPGLSEAQKQNTIKSNLFGAGFEYGNKTTLGCSYKGRVWSRRTTNLHDFTEWCSQIGRKLLDVTINPDEILLGTLVPEEIKRRPQVMPIGIEWPEIVYIDTETVFSFIVGEVKFSLQNTDICLINPTETGALKFRITSDEASIYFTLDIIENGEYGDFSFRQEGGELGFIEHRTKRVKLTEFFNENPPGIWFADGSSLHGNSYVELKQDHSQYPKEQIEPWDWAGTNIKSESQGITKSADSIQYKTIQELRQRPYDIIFDDDGKGEVADIVAIKVSDEVISVELYHCKYSQANKPGQRIGDLYEVCGQAQKSNRWVDRPDVFFSHLLRRESKRFSEHEVSRFEVGNTDGLIRIQEISRRVRIEFSIFIVQPGLSKANASDTQLRLLSVTENYLMETYMIPFGVIASP